MNSLTPDLTPDLTPEEDLERVTNSILSQMRGKQFRRHKDILVGEALQEMREDLSFVLANSGQSEDYVAVRLDVFESAVERLQLTQHSTDYARDYLSGREAVRLPLPGGLTREATIEEKYVR